MQLDASSVEISCTFPKSDNLVARELPVVGLTTHKIIAAELDVGTATPPFGRENPAAYSLVTFNVLVVRQHGSTADETTTYGRGSLAAYLIRKRADIFGSSDGTNHRN
jgi:hypothetical protein